MQAVGKFDRAWCYRGEILVEKQISLILQAKYQYHSPRNGNQNKSQINAMVDRLLLSSKSEAATEGVQTPGVRGRPKIIIWWLVLENRNRD